MTDDVIERTRQFKAAYAKSPYEAEFAEAKEAFEEIDLIELADFILAEREAREKAEADLKYLQDYHDGMMKAADETIAVVIKRAEKAEARVRELGL